MKTWIVFLVFLLIPSFQYADSEFSKGEKLQVLYERVWAYKNPDNVASRAGALSYSNNVTFVEEDPKYPGYIKIKAIKGNEYYIKADLVASSKKYSKDQLSDDIASGKRNRSQYARFNLYSYNPLDFWPTIGVSAVILLLLYFIYKNFYKFDQWFYRFSSKKKAVLNRPWFIRYALISGLVIGAFLTFISPTESEWFLYEGFRLWADFPSMIDYILWAAVMFFGLTLIMGILTPFIRFSPGIALFYLPFSVVLMAVYFITGVLTGGIVAGLLLISGMGGGSAGSPTDQNSVYDPSRSERWNKAERFWG